MNDELPESAKHVLSVIRNSAVPLRGNEISKLTGIPQRTVRYALQRLLNNGDIIQRVSMIDTRMMFYAPANRTGSYSRWSNQESYGVAADG